jgi:hypothetical protein
MRGVWVVFPAASPVPGTLPGIGVGGKIDNTDITVEGGVHLGN